MSTGTFSGFILPQRERAELSLSSAGLFGSSSVFLWPLSLSSAHSTGYFVASGAFVQVLFLGSSGLAILGMTSRGYGRQLP